MFWWLNVKGSPAEGWAISSPCWWFIRVGRLNISVSSTTNHKSCVMKVCCLILKSTLGPHDMRHLWHWIGVLHIVLTILQYYIIIFCSTISVPYISLKEVPKVWPWTQMWPSHQLWVVFMLLKLDISKLPQFPYLSCKLNSHSLCETYENILY